jgi:hypothetical protein
MMRLLILTIYRKFKKEMEFSNLIESPKDGCIKIELKDKRRSCILLNPIYQFCFMAGFEQEYELKKKYLIIHEPTD